jgi:hypothetical protein
MRLALCISFLLVIVQTSRAQEASPTKTLINGGGSLNTKHVGLVLAPSVEVTKMDGAPATVFGLRGGINLKDKFSLGAFFKTAINEIRPSSESSSNFYMDYKVWGGFAEYTVLSKKIIHLTFPIYVGYGEVEMDNELGDIRLGDANFFHIEPSALLEINLHKNVRVNIGSGYRVITQMTYRNLSNADISGLVGHMGLKFGIFKK